MNSCAIVSKYLKQIRELKAEFDAAISPDNFDLSKAEKLQEQIEDLILEAMFYQENQYAYRDRIAKKYGYDFVTCFNSSNIAIARIWINDEDDACFVIDKNGRKISEELRRCNDFVQGFAECRFPDDTLGLVTQTGEVIHAQGIFPPADNGIIKIIDHLNGDFFIDQNGNPINYERYLNAGTTFYDNLNWVVTEENDERYCSYIKTDGNPANIGKFKNASNFYNGFALVTDLDNKIKIIDTTGKAVIEGLANLQMENSFSDFKFFIYQDSNGHTAFNYLGPDGKILFDEPFDHATSMKEDTAWVEKGRDWYIAHADGRIKKVELEKIYINPSTGFPTFQDGLSFALLDDYGFGKRKLAAVDTEGKVVFEKDNINHIGEYHNGLASLRNKPGSYHLIDKKGIQSEEYTSLRILQDCMLVTKKELVDKGELAAFILDPLGQDHLGPFDEVTYCEGGLFLAKDKTDSRVIDYDGNVLFKGAKHLSYRGDGVYSVMNEDDNFIYIDRFGHPIFNHQKQE